MAILDIIRSAMLAGFGVQEKVREFIDDLVKKGELSESQGAKLVKEWSEKADKNAEDISKSLNELVQKALENQTRYWASTRRTQKLKSLSPHQPRIACGRPGQCCDVQEGR